MAKRSYVPRHAVVAEPSGVARGTTRAVTVLAASVGVAAATTALASPADAKNGHHSVWDRVASCESGQRWHVDTGNGYYGGLQFSASTWSAYHGAKYSGHADHATRMQQIQVARRVLKSQGADAWPVCGPRAGLTKHSGHATAAALPKNASSGSTFAGHKPKKSHLKSHQGQKAHKPHSAHHPVHKSKSRSHTSGVYVVRRGDTLSTIAAKEHVQGGWHALYRANRNHLKNPNTLHVGQHLRLP